MRALRRHRLAAKEDGPWLPRYDAGVTCPMDTIRNTLRGAEFTKTLGELAGQARGPLAVLDTAAPHDLAALRAGGVWRRIHEGLRKIEQAGLDAGCGRDWRGPLEDGYATLATALEEMAPPRPTPRQTRRMTPRHRRRR